MRFAYTDEMHKLMEIYEPYMKNGVIIDEAPPEAVEAERKFMELFKIEFEKNSRLDLL